MLVRGNLTVSLESKTLKIENKKITVSGVDRLAWAPLDPEKDFGKKAEMVFTVGDPYPYTLKAPAYITREYVGPECTMGLAFQLSPLQANEFRIYAQKHGEPPVTYTRRFPRIPSNHLTQTMRLKAVANIQGKPTVFEIEDLSPDGIMIFTGGITNTKIQPTEELSFALDARPHYPTIIPLRGVIRRIRDDVNPTQQTLIRHLGMQLSNVPEADQAHLMSLLKIILIQIRDQLKNATPT